MPRPTTANRVVGIAILPTLPSDVVWKAALLVAVVGFCYWPALSGGFLMDDENYITQSPKIVSVGGLSKIWFSTEPEEYYPISNTSFWLQWRLWGTNRAGYHSVSMAFHLTSAALVWIVLEELAIPGAFLATILFAVHPLNVESVAWIFQQRGLMALCFVLLSIIWYLRAIDRRKWYWISLLTFVVAMLSKGSVAILPLALLMIVAWKNGRIARSDVVSLIPFLVVAVVLTLVNVWFQRHGRSGPIRDITIAQRFVGAGAVPWFYLAKAFLPIELAFVYPPWEIRVHRLEWWLPLAAAAIVPILLSWRRRRAGTTWNKSLLFFWAYFCLALIPVMGFTDTGFMQYSHVANHYAQLALIGALAAATAAWSYWSQNSRSVFQSAAKPTAIVACVLLMFLTFQQSRLYGNSVWLYEDALKKNPRSWLAENNLGLALVETGNQQEAIDHFRKALALKPDFARAYYNWGTVLSNTGQPKEAIERFRQALEYDPDYLSARYNLGTELYQIGQLSEAIVQLKKAVALNPNFAWAHVNLGEALALSGESAEALKQLEQALRLKSDSAEIQFDLANTYLKVNQPQQAIEHFRQAVVLDPQNCDALNDLAVVLVKLDRIPEAIPYFQSALQIKPDFFEARYSLANALSKIGRFNEAIENYVLALKLHPDSADIYCNFGTALIQAGRRAEAVQHIRRALELKPDYPEAENNLGMTHLRMNQPQLAAEHLQRAVDLNTNYEEAWANLAVVRGELHESEAAIFAAQKAIDLAKAQNKTVRAQQIEAWLNSYRASLNRSNP